MQTREKLMPYGAWKETLNALVRAKVGLALEDLSDLDCEAAYATGQVPEEYFDSVVRDELNDLGFAIELLDFLEDDGLYVHDFDGDEERAEAFLAGEDEPF